MAKAPKPAPLPVTAEVIGKAAKTNSIRDLVSLAEAFYRAGAFGPFVVDLPIFTSVHIDGKGYRKMNIPVGTKLGTHKVSIGKKQGLIFAFDPATPLKRDDMTVERVEMGWDDIINTFDGLSEQIEQRLVDAGASKTSVKEIDEAIKATIGRNPSMHKILTEGFSLAQVHSKQGADDGALEALPEFGMF